jgi:3-dehydroquinate dehydratase/shikimate dehydrogenase
VTIVNRTRGRAEELAREVGATVADLEDGAGIAYEVLVNGTSQGMGKPDETPWPTAWHRPGTVVFDTVYTPQDTRLLRDAVAAGAIPVYGRAMFVAQAAAQFHRFTGREADPAHLAGLLG